MDLPRDDPLSLDFDPALGEYNAIEFPRNHHMISFDLPLHACSFAENQAVAGDHVSLYLRVDAEHAGGLERSLKFDALVEETCKFVLLSVFVSSF